MTWAEFRIRLFAFNRIEKNDLYKLREVCYQIYVSGYFGKGKPVSKDRYWAIDKKQISVSDRAIERLKEAQAEYRKKKNGRTS
jgi:hypothetical protein